MEKYEIPKFIPEKIRIGTSTCEVKIVEIGLESTIGIPSNAKTSGKIIYGCKVEI